MAQLSQLEWPGNIRQLENAVYRAVVMSDGDLLGLTDFPPAVAQSPQSEALRQNSEPLIFEPVLHPGGPARISGSEIPIAPLPSIGTLAMLDNAGEIRPLEALESEIIRSRDFALSRANVRSRAPIENRRAGRFTASLLESAGPGCAVVQWRRLAVERRPRGRRRTAKRHQHGGFEDSLLVRRRLGQRRPVGPYAPYDYFQSDHRNRRTLAEDLRLIGDPSHPLFGGLRWLAGVYGLRLTESDDLAYVWDDQYNGAGSSDLLQPLRGHQCGAVWIAGGRRDRPQHALRRPPRRAA